MICFWSSRPEHNQRPLIDTAKHRFALIPTRRKNAVWPLGAQSNPSLARGRSGALGRRPWCIFPINSTLLLKRSVKQNPNAWSSSCRRRVVVVGRRSSAGVGGFVVI